MSEKRPSSSPRVRADLERVGFVGRREIMDLLQHALEDAVGGRGRLILLAGEPGIGKTRTAEELAARAHDQGAKVVWGRCYEGEGAPAFWPWVEILRAGMELLAPQELETATERAVELAQLVAPSS